MQEPPPLKLDLRLLLESLSSGLAFVLAGIAAVDLAEPYNIIVPLVVMALIVTVNRILGKNVTDSMTTLIDSINRLVASNSVLRSDATPTVIRQADEAGAAIMPVAKVTPPADPPGVTSGGA